MIRLSRLFSYYCCFHPFLVFIEIIVCSRWQSQCSQSACTLGGVVYLQQLAHSCMESTLELYQLPFLNQNLLPILHPSHHQLRVPLLAFLGLVHSSESFLPVGRLTTGVGSLHLMFRNNCLFVYLQDAREPSSLPRCLLSLPESSKLRLPKLAC